MKLEIALASNFKTRHDNTLGHIIESDHGHVAVLTGGQFSPTKHSITEFIVSEEHRGSGHGTALIREVIQRYKADIGAQVSSMPSLVVMYKLGFRPALKMTASLEETKSLFKEEWGSLLLVYKPARDF